MKIPAIAKLLFCVIILGHTYFTGAGGWNQSARIAAALTFVEPGPDRGTFRIDPYTVSNDRGLNTGDYAEGVDGHRYPNKAPGSSILCVPAYAVLYALESLVGVNVRTTAATRFNLVILNLWCSTFWSALAALVFYLFLLATKVTPREALTGALIYSFATLVFPYDTSIWGHSTASACLLIAYCLAFWPGKPQWHWLAGLAAGLAVLVEYTSIFPAAALAITVVTSKHTDRRARWSFVVGATGAALALLAYQKLVFGGFLTPSVATENPMFHSKRLVFGVLGMPDPEALWALTFSLYRGMLVFCPVFLFSFLGAYQLWRKGERPLVLSCTGAIVASFLFVSSFNAWWGGWCSGPRYLIITTPLWVLLLPRPSALSRQLRTAYLGLVALSTLNMLAMTAVEVMVDENERNPLYGLAYRLVFSAQYPHNQFTRNFGSHAVGLPPPFDLVLYLLFFGTMVYLLFRESESQVAPAKNTG